MTKQRQPLHGRLRQALHLVKNGMTAMEIWTIRGLMVEAEDRLKGQKPLCRTCKWRGSCSPRTAMNVSAIRCTGYGKR
jgi:hypothetical protein